MPELRLGTRGSALALAQARGVEAAIREANEGLETEVVPIRTTGDRPRRPAVDDKSRFVKEIEEALLERRVDLAVHSAKDVPGELPDGLAIVAVPQRAEPRDSLVGAASLDELAEGAVVGTSSLRRRAQLLASRPDLRVEEIRGNVDTRLGRLEAGEFDALVLAGAGLARLGRDLGAAFAPEEMTPAPGQGALALEARAGDAEVARLVSPLTDHDALVSLTAERAVVEALGATCRTPVGAHATADGERLRVSAFAGLPDGSAWVRDELDGSRAEPAAAGWAIAERMLAAGAGELLAAADEAPSA